MAYCCKCKSQDTPSDVLYLALASLPKSLTTQLTALKPGFTALKSKPGGLAQDFVRGGLFKRSDITPLPADKPGDYNDLREIVDHVVGLSIADPDSAVFAFGQKWGPEKQKDQYFHFTPARAYTTST